MGVSIKSINGIWQKVIGGNNTLRIYLASIMLGLLAFTPHPSFAQESIFSQANCTIIYSLKRSADKYFNDEIFQLTGQINRKSIHLIDLNSWRKTPPHIDISGRLRHQLREQYDLNKNVNQAVIVNQQGRVLSRYSGSVTLVNALIDCK